MFILKKLVGSALIISVLMFPTSAFASKDNHSQNSHNNGNNQSIINKILSFVSNSHNSQNDFKNFWDNNKDVRDWYENNKNNHPKVESYDIWKDWYCK
ncbi:hypothetical protein [Paenibacillus sp. FSL H8-0034]|uniref:hypothetical protein n=1 Tax=Paenibacillus sp. FSL H8-0034 TaxID=2954671 RepID=UPI0030FCC1A6